MTQASATTSQQLLTFSIGGQNFGLSVLDVNDVLGPQKITHTPMSPPAIAGIMNLRGRIVTAIDMRRCLDQEARAAGKPGMSVVVENKGELFSLIIDSVGDVLFLSADDFETTPVTLDDTWRSVSNGLYKLDGKILVVLDVEKLLKTAHVNSKGSPP